MNLTLALGVNGGGVAAKKRKVMEGVGVFGAAEAGDRATVMMLLQARDRMVKVERDHVEDEDMSDSGGSPLMRLLLSSAVAGEVGDTHAAAVALQEVYRHASFRGADPVQRVAAYFADALASRLLLPPAFPSAATATATVTRAEQFLALTMFYQASPFYQFAHFTANQAIVEAFEASGRRRLHVVDFDVSFGFQWPSLIQSLSDAATASSSQSSQDDSGDCCDEPVSLRITGFGTSGDELRDTEARLARFADGCPNLRFEFEGVVNYRPEDDGRHERIIKTDPSATVVVNLVFPAAQSASWATRSALARIRSLDPSMVFLIDKIDESGMKGTGKHGGASLLPRFAANLRYYAAVFESLHECLPADSAERIAIERDHLGVEISDAMASLDRRRHGDDRAAGQIETSRSWKERLESAGFEGARLSSRTVSQAKLLLKMKSGGCGGGGFHVIEGGGDDDDKAMALGWRNRALITASAWRPCRHAGDRPARTASETCVHSFST